MWLWINNNLYLNSCIIKYQPQIVNRIECDCPTGKTLFEKLKVPNKHTKVVLKFKDDKGEKNKMVKKK